MLLRRVIEHVKSQNWTAIALDFLIVVAGVFVGVQVNEWWLSRIDARKEHAYLLQLKQDLGQVKRQLDRDTKEYEGIALAMLALLEESRRDKPKLSVAELNQNCSQLINMVGTTIVSDTYTNLTGSGELVLIRSQDLRNALASFYALNDIIQLVQNTHELQLVNTFQPYIVDNLDYLAGFELDDKRTLRADIKQALPAAFNQDRVLHVLPSPQFRNVVAIKWDITTDILDVLADTMERAREVEELLDRELEKSSS
jgi:hypothetical protein